MRPLSCSRPVSTLLLVPFLFLLFEEEVNQALIFPGVVHYALSGFAISPSSARFLIEGLHRFRGIDVDYGAHVRLVNTHPEGHGGDDDSELVRSPPRQDLLLEWGGDASMISLDLDVEPSEATIELFCCGITCRPFESVDDS